MSLPDITNILTFLVVLVALPANWIVAARLWWLSRIDPTLAVLKERAALAVGVALLVTVFSLIFINNDQATPPLSFEQTKLITRTTLLTVSTATALFWLRIYLHRND